MKIYLDLLPQEKKNELKRKKIFAVILREEILFLLPLVLFIIILFNIYYVLNLQHSSSVAAGAVGKNQNKYQELNSYEERFSNVNEAVSVLSKIQAGHLRWQNLFQEISSITPEGITISDISTKNYQIFLVGKARTRDDLLKFKDNIEKSSCFEKLNVPLSNLVVKDDVDFQMNVDIKDTCLKRQV